MLNNKFYRRLVIAGLLLAFFSFLGGCAQEGQADDASGQATAEAQEKARNVRVLELKPQTLEEYFEITGPMTPVQGADISAEESGAVVDLPAAKGMAVNAGQALVEQDRSILKAEMEAAASNFETQDYNLDKVRQLFDAGKISRIELLNTKTAHAAARSQASITAQRYRRAMVRAPFAGVVADRYVELGEMVLPGQPVVRVIDPFTLKMEGYLTSSQIAYAQVGSQAVIRIGEEETPAEGTITWVGLEADRKTGKFKVEVEVPNPELALRSGVIGRARISKNSYLDVVNIPRDAIMEGRHGLEVFVVEGDRAYRRAVTIGADQGALVVVTSGLQAGETLVVRGHRDLVEGALVRITERATTADGSTASDPLVVKDETGAGK